MRPSWARHSKVISSRPTSASSREVVEAGAKGVNFSRLNREAGSHRMTAVAHEQIAALAQRGRQIKPGNAAPGPAPFSAIAADDNRRPIKLLKHPGGHNPHDANVPPSS